jgi:hypothetical protein
LYVACSFPFAVDAVPSSEAEAPVPADGADDTSRGGHRVVHGVLVQVTLPPMSAVSMYSVRPDPSTSTVPTPVALAALIVDIPDDVWDPEPVELEPEPPHAAASSASATTGIAALRIRRNLISITPPRFGLLPSEGVRPNAVDGWSTC